MQFHLKNRMPGLYRGSFNVNLCRLCDGKLTSANQDRSLDRWGIPTLGVFNHGCPVPCWSVILWAGGWTRDPRRGLLLTPLQLQENQSYSHQGSRGYLSQEGAIGKAEGTTSQCWGLPHSPNRHFQHLECRSKDENLPSQMEQDRIISWEKPHLFYLIQFVSHQNPKQQPSRLKVTESWPVVWPEDKDVACKLLRSLLISLMLK